MTTEVASPLLGTGTLARVLRMAVALLIVAASIQSYGNKFLFQFTILSNLLAVVMFAGQAIRPDWMRSNAFLRGAVTLYMTVTGLVYAVVLASLGADVGDYVPWANFIHHNLAPEAMLIDWLLFPPRQKLNLSAPLLRLIFPAAYQVFSVFRGTTAGFYPYPFLNPDEVGGVAIYAAVILAVFWVVAWLIRWWADRRGVIPEMAT